MSPRTKVIFWLTAWAIVLMPFLFWRSTWFGRPLTDSEVTQYLADNAKPRHIQHALVQISERIGRRDASASRWYPDLVRLAASPVEEIRNTDAWVMGQDTSHPEFHQALLVLLRDPSTTVRGNAALSLVRFGDDAGRPEILSLLQPVAVAAPAAGTVSDAAKLEQTVREHGLLARIGDVEVRAPSSGRVASVRPKGAAVSKGDQLAVLDPPVEQAWEALRALYVIGRPEDLATVRSYERNDAELPDRVRQQARETERSILERSKAAASSH